MCNPYTTVQSLFTILLRHFGHLCTRNRIHQHKLYYLVTLSTEACPLGSRNCRRVHDTNTPRGPHKLRMGYAAHTETAIFDGPGKQTWVTTVGGEAANNYTNSAGWWKSLMAKWLEQVVSSGLSDMKCTVMIWSNPLR